MSGRNLLDYARNEKLWGHGQPEAARYAFHAKGGVYPYLLEGDVMRQALRNTVVKGGVGRFIEDLDGSVFTEIIDDRYDLLNEKVRPLEKISSIHLWMMDVVTVTRRKYPERNREVLELIDIPRHPTVDVQRAAGSL